MVEVVHSRTQDAESNPSSPSASFSSLEFYERLEISTPIVGPKRPLPPSPGHNYNTLASSHGNAGDDMSESSPTSRSHVGSSQRRSRSQQGNVLRTLSQSSSQASTPNNVFPENVHLASVSYAPTNVQYGLHPSFHANYSFLHYPNPVVAESNIIPQSVHTNYHPMLQPPLGTVFPYQRHSPDGNSASIPQGSPLYGNPQMPTSSHVSPPIPPSSGSITHYVGSSPFHSSQYSSPITPSPYAYHPHPFSPVYQPQYPIHPTFHGYSSQAGEADSHGTWYYSRPSSVSSPYERRPSHHAYFPTTYSNFSQQGIENIVHGQSRPPPAVDGSATSKVELETSVLSTPASSSTMNKPIVRRQYHPNPPTHRSEWVMWAGNVPSDATHDELWRFFNRQLPERPVDSPEATGVISIFLISKSSCAFVNYKSQFFLEEAITRFNGVPVRSGDSRCPRLVCRARRVEDDLKAGVGGQRGIGMHLKWIKDRKGKQRDVGLITETPSISSSKSAASLSERMAVSISVVSMLSEGIPEENERQKPHVKHSSSSGSYASTNSSFLIRHFRKRYFILKSLTSHDLDLSVETGLWATQKHNEEILDQAFRTSEEVYLIFGANKSGEFYGYARMVGPVRRGQQNVSWASRSPRGRGETYFPQSDLRLVESSPLPVDVVTPDEGIVHRSAPAMLGEQYMLPSGSPVTKFSLDQGLSRGIRQKVFRLDDKAPQRAMRHQDEELPQTTLQSVDEFEEQETKAERDDRVLEERKGPEGPAIFETPGTMTGRSKSHGMVPSLNLLWANVCWKSGRTMQGT